MSSCNCSSSASYTHCPSCPPVDPACAVPDPTELKCNADHAYLNVTTALYADYAAIVNDPPTIGTAVVGTSAIDDLYSLFFDVLNKLHCAFPYCCNIYTPIFESYQLKVRPLLIPEGDSSEPRFIATTSDPFYRVLDLFRQALNATGSATSDQSSKCYPCDCSQNDILFAKSVKNLFFQVFAKTITIGPVVDNLEEITINAGFLCDANFNRAVATAYRTLICMHSTYHLQHKCKPDDNAFFASTTTPETGVFFTNYLNTFATLLRSWLNNEASPFPINTRLTNTFITASNTFKGLCVPPGCSTQVCQTVSAQTYPCGYGFEISSVGATGALTLDVTVANGQNTPLNTGLVAQPSNAVQVYIDSINGDANPNAPSSSISYTDATPTVTPPGPWTLILSKSDATVFDNTDSVTITNNITPNAEVATVDLGP